MTRKQWADSFDLTKTELITLKESGNTALILSRDSPGDPYPRAPIYHVWHGNTWAYCGQSQLHAEKLYEELTDKGT